MLRLAVRACGRGGTILCFHSITTPVLPAEGICHVSKHEFTSLVRLSRRLGDLVPLSEFVKRYQQGRSTAGLIAVTFDDAYAALKTAIKDVVSREGIPITVFPVTDAAARGATFWWDRVDDVFPLVSSDRWRAFETACGVPDAYRHGQPREYGPLRPLRQWVLAAHAGRWPGHLEPALALLEAEAGSKTRHRSMTFAELTDLAAMPEVELGVHTVSHPVLPLLSDLELRHEIAAGYEGLRERYRNVRPVLAIPFGLFDDRTLRVARSAGMAASFTLGGSTPVHDQPEHALGRLCIMKGATSARLGLDLLGVPHLVRAASGRRSSPYPALPSATT